MSDEPKADQKHRVGINFSFYRKIVDSGIHKSTT